MASVTFEKGSQLKTIDGGIINYDYYGAFARSKNLTTVDMSECTHVEYIGSGAFDNTKLSLFKIGTMIPPACEDSAFRNSGAFSSILKVPVGCVEAYKEAEGWSRFSSITELDE